MCCVTFMFILSSWSMQGLFGNANSELKKTPDWVSAGRTPEGLGPLQGGQDTAIPFAASDKVLRKAEHVLAVRSVRTVQASAVAVIRVQP